MYSKKIEKLVEEILALNPNMEEPQRLLERLSQHDDFNNLLADFLKNKLECGWNSPLTDAYHQGRRDERRDIKANILHDVDTIINDVDYVRDKLDDLRGGF